MKEDLGFGIFVGIMITLIIATIIIGLLAPVSFGTRKFEDVCESRGYDTVVIDFYSNTMCVNYVDVDMALIRYDNFSEDN